MNEDGEGPLEPYVALDDAYVGLFVCAQRVARRIVGEDSEAEDVAAEAMVRAMSSWRRIHTYSIPWVTRVAANLAIDVLRRRRQETISAPGLAPAVDTTDRLALLLALDKLPGRQRQAVVLRHVVGLSYLEASEAMGVKPQTVKTHLRRALATLRIDLQEESADVS